MAKQMEPKRRDGRPGFSTRPTHATASQASQDSQASQARPARPASQPAKGQPEAGSNLDPRARTAGGTPLFLDQATLSQASQASQPGQ